MRFGSLDLMKRLIWQMEIGYLAGRKQHSQEYNPPPPPPPRNEYIPIFLFQQPKTEFPEGSRLKLHFPLYESSNGGQDGEVTSCDLEPPSGLTFANVSPSMCLSRGYEAYCEYSNAVSYTDRFNFF